MDETELTYIISLQILAFQALDMLLNNIFFIILVDASQKSFNFCLREIRLFWVLVAILRDCLLSTYTRQYEEMNCKG